MSEKNKLMKLCFKAGAMQMAIKFHKNKNLFDGVELDFLEKELSKLKKFVHPHVEDETITLDAVQNKDDPNSYKVG